MENSSTGMLIAAFVAIIIGAVLIGTIAQESQALTSSIGVLNETFSVTAAIITANGSGVADFNISHNYTLSGLNHEKADSSKDNFVSTDCITQFGNGSGTWTEDTDYAVDCEANTFHFLNATAIAAMTDLNNTNSTRISYEFENEDYLRENWNRTILDLVPGFMAIALLLIAVGLFYDVARREGWLNSI